METNNKNQKLTDMLDSLKWILCGLTAFVYGIGYFTYRSLENHNEAVFLLFLAVFAGLGYVTGLGLSNSIKKLI